MTPITSKSSTDRLAVATATISFSNSSTYSILRDASLKKGDALAVARVAGIMAVKRTADLIPLAHPGLGITGVEVDVDLIPPHSREREVKSPDSAFSQYPSRHHQSLTEPTGNTDSNQTPTYLPDLKEKHGGVVITTRVSCHARTGVEMEALTAATVAGLTVYDMCKACDRGMVMHDVRVLRKEGGRSGSWWFDPDGNGGMGQVRQDVEVRNAPMETAAIFGGVDVEDRGQKMSSGYGEGTLGVRTATGMIDDGSTVAKSAAAASAAASASGPDASEAHEDPDRDVLGGGWSWLQQTDTQRTGGTSQK